MPFHGGFYDSQQASIPRSFDEGAGMSAFSLTQPGMASSDSLTAYSAARPRANTFDDNFNDEVSGDAAQRSTLFSGEAYSHLSDASRRLTTLDSEDNTDATRLTAERYPSGTEQRGGDVSSIHLFTDVLSSSSPNTSYLASGAQNDANATPTTQESVVRPSYASIVANPAVG